MQVSSSRFSFKVRPRGTASKVYEGVRSERPTWSLVSRILGGVDLISHKLFGNRVTAGLTAINIIKVCRVLYGFCIHVKLWKRCCEFKMDLSLSHFE
jgi:hypothetical protein